VFSRSDSGFAGEIVTLLDAITEAWLFTPMGEQPVRAQNVTRSLID